MLHLIKRGAIAVCVAGLVGFGAADMASAEPTATSAMGGHCSQGSRPQVVRCHGGHYRYRHWHRGARGGEYWPDGRRYYGIPAHPYSDNTRCGALHSKALQTGSSTWWRRYRTCLG